MGQDGVGETCPLREVLGVPLQVGEVSSSVIPLINEYERAA